MKELYTRQAGEGRGQAPGKVWNGAVLYHAFIHPFINGLFYKTGPGSALGQREKNPALSPVCLVK